jgi:phenylalanyl-tRNA synthetase beta chain
MKFSYNWLQSYFNKKLPAPEKLAELLTLHFAEVEKVEKIGKDFSLDIDVRPNRAGDCLSHNGVAREISAILDFKLKIQNQKIKESNKIKVKDLASVQLLGKGHCLRYAARVVEGVKVEQSSKEIQERLISCGLRPINNIVDVANYVMLETGQPLHVFDGDKIGGKKIIVRFAREGEKITTLDGQKVNLNENILVIADEQKPMAIAGIKGGQDPEVDGKTKTIVIEAANFNSKIIREASQKINLRTDASIRFEHGLDPNLAEEAVLKAAYLIQKTAGGKIAKGMIDIYPKKVLSKLIKLDLAYVKSLLGIEILSDQIKNILEGLGFEIKNKMVKNPKFLDVIVPTLRVDISIPENLIEEIGRIFGYEKIPAVFPETSLIVPKINQNLLWEKIIKDALKETDFCEVYNYFFVSKKEADLFGYKTDDLIEVLNPLSSDFQYLRPNLLINMLKVAERNQKNFQNIKIFEFGKIFIPPKKEQKMITGLFFGNKFYEAKGIVDFLLNRLGISDIWYDEYRTPEQEKNISWWHPQKCAEIKVGQDIIGFLGEVSQKLHNDFKIDSKVVYFDIFFEKLSELASEEHEYRPISKFPAAIRDVAVLVPRETKVEDVLNKIETVGGQIIRDIDLFDIYEGENIPGQKKNLAFHIIFQAEDKTLSSEEIEVVFNKIIKALGETPEWQVRK